MMTQPEALALVTETDAIAIKSEDEDEQPSIFDEAPATNTQPDFHARPPAVGNPQPISSLAFGLAAEAAWVAAPEADPTSKLELHDTLVPVEAGEPTEQLDTNMIQAPQTTVIEDDEDEDDGEATMQLDAPSPTVMTEVRATIPDAPIDLPVAVPLPPPIVENVQPKPMVVIKRRSPINAVVLAAAACAIGFGLYVAVMRWVRTRAPSDPSLSAQPRHVSKPKIVPRDNEAVAAPAVTDEEELPEGDLEPSVDTPRKRAPKSAAVRARELEREGRRAVLAGDLLRAEKLLLECTRLAQIAACHRSLGVLYAQTGRTKESIEQYRKYLELAPKAADADNVKKILAEAER
jgi:hypothetical protein